MWIVEVFPITRSPVAYGPLTYFSTKKLEPGALVEVILRRKTVQAIVFKAERLELKKAALKRESFSLKKINRVVSERFVVYPFLAALLSASKYFLITPSFLLNFFLPKAVLKKNDISGFKKAGKNAPPKISFYQADRPERIKYYRAVCREALSRGQSVLALLPTISSAEEAFSDLRLGLEEKVFLIHGDMASKVLIKNWKEILESETPVISVGTAQVLAALRPDAGVLIVEEESNEHYYQTLRRPFFDIRKAAEFLVQAAGLHMISGDIVLRLGADESQFLAMSVSRVLSPAESKIIDSRPDKSSEFKIISQELEDRLKESCRKKESVVVIGHRRGFNPITLCRDCGHVISCNTCSSPLVIHQRKIGEENHFFCHYCLKKSEIAERCPNCKSWRLGSYGIGVEKIGHELKNIFPETKLFRFDRDFVRSRKEAETLKNEFLKLQGGILVATELFLNFFKNPLPHIAVASIDGLFSVPDYRMHERIMIFLTRLRVLAQKSFIIQTRLPDNPLFLHASGGNISGFKNEELAERKKLGYPPEVDLIKITLEDINRARLVTKISELARSIKELKSVNAEPFECVDFPAFIVKVRGRFRWHILLRLARGSWPEKHEELWRVLKGLPPSWIIQVDPPSLL